MWQLVTTVKCKHRASNSWTNLRINRICDLCFFCFFLFPCSLCLDCWALHFKQIFTAVKLQKVWDSLRLLDSDTKKAFEPGRFQFMFNHPLDKIGKSENLSVFANACNPLSAGRSPICFFCVFHAPVYYTLLLYYFPSPWLYHSWVYDIHRWHRRNLQIKWQIKWILEIRKESHQGQGEIQGDPSPTQWGIKCEKIDPFPEDWTNRTAAFARGFVLAGTPRLLLNVQRVFQSLLVFIVFHLQLQPCPFEDLDVRAFFIQSCLPR